MSDVAYHYNKMQRGFDHLIDLWGADHHGYIRRCEAMLAAWGYPGALEVVLGQLVNLFRDGKAVRMSKRTGEMVTFEELIDEVGVDATRYLMLSRSSDQPIDFDIEVAKKKDASTRCTTCSTPTRASALFCARQLAKVPSRCLLTSLLQRSSPQMSTLACLRTSPRSPLCVKWMTLASLWPWQHATVLRSA